MNTADEPRSYVQSLDLPELRSGFASFAIGAEPQFSSRPQALAVGSQLAEFSGDVDPEARAAVADSLLIAQLAANKAADQEADVLAWYRKYIEVLQGVGWLVGALEFESQTVSDLNADVHRAIVPVLTAMLGPAAAATSLVLTVLSGLESMNRDSPWIAAFDRASRHASGAKFQVSQVDVAQGGDPRITALCFGIEAKRTVTQVLFFSFSNSSAELKKAQGTLSMPASRLLASSGVIAERVRPFVTDYVRNIDI